MTEPRFTVEPWTVREPHVDPEAMAISESVFALSNGYLGTRGTLDEVEPHGERGTFLAGVHETHPLAYPESAYGNPDEGQVIVRVADATSLRLVVDGIPLDVRTADVTAHERCLDLRTGVLERRLTWRTPRGTTMELHTRRLVSLTERAVVAVRYELWALDGPAHVVVRSELAVGTGRPEVENPDPRVAEALDHPFEVAHLTCDATGGALVARTRRTRIAIAAAVQHEVTGAGDVSTEAVSDDHIVTCVTAELDAGAALRIDKFAGQVWHTDSAADSMLEAARGVVDAGVDRGWAGLAADQRAVLDGFWRDADVEIDGDDELQQGVRYSLFVLFTSTACLCGAPLGGKGLSGLGYSGHTFWDIEGFVVPALSLLAPDAARRLLEWRAGTLDHARARAREIDVRGATFAWRTIDGTEASAYWPASTAAMHINADIARAFRLYGHVTGEDAPGALDVLVETARLWASIGHADAVGAWHYFGMTGPDEYTGFVDDNVFTNLMAGANLRWAAAACEERRREAAGLGVTDEEIARWRAVAEAIHIPWDEERGVHPANENFLTYREWRFEDKKNLYPVQEHQHYAKFYRRQVLKQADLVQAIWWCGAGFTDEQVARDVDHYEARTVRDSSLSACVQAVVCAQAQHPDLAYRYLREAALMDLRNVNDDTEKGQHLASVGGTWLAVAAGLGGLREDREELTLAPLLPAAISRLAYRLRWRGSHLRVEIGAGFTTVTVLDGPAVPVVIDGNRLEASPGRPAVAPLREPTPLLLEPTQPVGREPRV